MAVEVIIPSAGRPSLAVLLDALDRSRGPQPRRVIVVDDRDAAASPLPVPIGVDVVPGPGRGPAAARNAGWRAAGASWVAFLDDDVVVPPDWLELLAADLAAAGPDVAGSQGRIRVPLPEHRKPTDWERNVSGLEHARWATADMAYRRSALERAGGFDERFPRAYREDADIGLRLTAAGWRIVAGSRTVLHPVGPADAWVSLRKQWGNADDVLMRELHGRHWRQRAGAPHGRLRMHLATAAVGTLAVVSLAARARRIQRLAGAAWLAATADFAWRRIAPGPRGSREVATMAVTSALIPFAATAAWAHGQLRKRALVRDTERAPRPRPRPVADAVLLDRDGTLVVDVPYNGDPARVEAMPGARAALDRLRAAGIPLAVISNQSGVGRGWIGEEDLAAVNARVEDLLGPLGEWHVCPHHPDAGCDCRKPAPGLLLQAAGALHVDPRRCVVIGDIGADIQAAAAVGARGILVPTSVTRAEEIRAAPEVAPSLPQAVDMVLGA
ncbi:MAG: hypothetical protein QOD24_595 [Solirubrobacteraceae bacterium]|nr:hypothetical protein [Solirubrobacteraceae bacterium]